MTTSTEAISAAERAYRVIRDGIVRGEHEPGVMLGEAALAAGLGVSRTPVRVALARLQDEGWITVYPKRGALVSGLSERTVAELADARFVLESTSIDRASAARRGALAERLDASVAAQRAAFAAGDVAGFIDLTVHFHRGFVESAESRVFLELYDRLAQRHRFVLFAARERLIARCAQIIAEHEKLVECVRSSDVAGFAAALRSHISEFAADGPAGTGWQTRRDE